MENITKKCSKCGRELPLSEFNKDKSRKDGLQSYCKSCQKQYKKQWYADNPEYNKQYYATIEGYARNIRKANLQEDRKYGRIGAEEDPLPPHSYYIEKFSEGIDYYDGKKYPFNELGFDRIDDSKPHTIDNVIVATTEHNVDKHHKHMSVEEYREYIQKQNEELDIALS